MKEAVKFSVGAQKTGRPSEYTFNNDTWGNRRRYKLFLIDNIDTNIALQRVTGYSYSLNLLL